MMDRLDDLVHDLRHHDFTIRRTLQGINEESEIQRAIALRLTEVARDAYVVTRESQVADRKEPDIRLAAVRGDQKASIEVKIADSWSLRDLETALRHQLVGQYLRHESGRAGCLLLTYHGRKKRWKHVETRASLDFNAVLEYLATQARAIEAASSPGIRLAVCGVDLTDRK